jgi:hypothetical protein
MGASFTLMSGIQIGKSFSLFAKSGYIWHKKLYTETSVQSDTFASSIFYRTIPIHAGIYLTLFNREKYRLSAFADGGYNIIYRHVHIPQISQHNLTYQNGYGYTVGVLCTLFNSVPLSLGIGIGKKEETKYINFFSYLNLYPSIFKRNSNK